MTHLSIRGEALKRAEWKASYAREITKINATLMIAIVGVYVLLFIRYLGG